MSMLKTNVSLQVLIANEIITTNEVSGIEDGDELIEKCGKLSKSQKLSKTRKLFKFQKLSKTGKLSKSQKSAKSGKKSLKNENLPNFDTKKSGASFLTSDTRTTFNHL